MTEFPSETTLLGFLHRHAQDRGLVPALLGPGWKEMTHAALYAEVTQMGASFAAMGLGRGSRIAMALPSGPPMATALLSTMTWAACAPLNPAIDVSTSKANLERLHIDALIAPIGDDPPAVAAAVYLGIPVLRLSPIPYGSAARFAIRGEVTRAAVAPEKPRPDDLALLMQTSGTTGKPKVVPLTQANIVESLGVRAKVMQITQADRCLCLSPLFISTVIMRSLLTPLLAGGSVICTPGFRAESFIEWLGEFGPTYFAASPTIHASIIDLLARGQRAEVRTLRFVSAGGSALPPAVQARLEELLGVPVIQTYGMTETGTIAQNPLPPGHRRSSSVGLPLVEISILGDGRDFLSHGQRGEVVVRGPGVMSGYEDDAEANQLAFVDGWFRTGDLGYVDENGYLFLAGRIKEIINRGGLKVSPREVDEVLLRHPAVAAAAAFPVAHPTLGEDLAAAVMLRGGSAITEREVRQFAAQHLAQHEVPSRIMFVEELPRNAQGKVMRGELAAALAALPAPNTKVAARDKIELHLVKLWEELLKVSPIGIEDNFFALGGDSLLAAQVVAAIELSFGRRLPMDVFWVGTPTVAHLAGMLRAGEHEIQSPVLVQIKPGGNKPPLFCVHTQGGNLFHYYPLARCLDAEQPVFGLQARGVYGSSRPRCKVEDIAADCVAAIREQQPVGPYSIAGYSSAGAVALETARQLLDQGEHVSPLALIDCCVLARRSLRHRLRRMREVGLMRAAQERAYYWLLTRIGRPDLRRLRTIGETQHWAQWSYVMRPYHGGAQLFVTSHSIEEGGGDDTLGWGRIVTGPLVVHRFQATHTALVKPPAVQELAAALQACLDADSSATAGRLDPARVSEAMA